MAGLSPQRVSEEAPPEMWEEPPAPGESAGESTAAAERLLKPEGEGLADLASRLADAQEYLGRLELARLHQDLRIHELEATLQAEPSTRTPSLPASARTPSELDASWLDGARWRSGGSVASTEDLPSSSKTPLRHTPQLTFAARRPAGLQIRTEELWGDLDSQDGAGSEMVGCGLSIPSTPEPFRQPRWEQKDASIRSPVASGPPSFHTLPLASLHDFYPSCAMAPVAHHHCNLPWYQVTFPSGVEIRAEPDADGPTAGTVLPRHAVFQASELATGADARVYLRLADGRGWVFDDAALYPENPSVVLMSPYELSSPCALPAPSAVPAASMLLSTTPASAHSSGQSQVARYAAAVAPPPCAVPMDACDEDDEDDEEVQEIPFDEDEDLEVEEEDLTGAACQWRRGKRGGQKRRKRGGVKHRSKTES